MNAKTITFGKKIKEYRKKHNIKLQDFASKLNEYGVSLSKGGLSLIEHGERFPHLETFLAICMLCGSTPNEMLDYDENKVKRIQMYNSFGDQGAISSIG